MNTEELGKRLRRQSQLFMEPALAWTMEQAAETIERQTAAIKELRGALAVFAAEADAQDARNPNAGGANYTIGKFTIADVRAARSAMRIIDHMSKPVEDNDYE